MMPCLSLIGLMTLAVLRANPPREARMNRGCMSAEQVRAFERWEMAIERADAAARFVPRDPNAASVVDAIIFGLLQRDDDNANAAGRELAAAYEVWKAQRAGKPLATEALTTT